MGCFADGAAAMLALRGTGADQRERLTWRVRVRREVSPRGMALIDYVPAGQRTSKADNEQAA